jgi:hypothetical protein
VFLKLLKRCFVGIGVRDVHFISRQANLLWNCSCDLTLTITRRRRAMVHGKSATVSPVGWMMLLARRFVIGNPPTTWALSRTRLEFQSTLLDRYRCRTDHADIELDTEFTEAKASRICVTLRNERIGQSDTVELLIVVSAP